MTWKDELLIEIEKGGDESACPYCKVPRVQRSNYIRCCRCGINWISGESLDHDPRAERLRNFLESAKATAPRKAEGK